MSSFGKYLLIILSVWVGVYAYGKFGPGFPITSVVTQKTDLFTVSGEGKVTVTPDVAIFNLGMTTQKNSVKLAQAEANTVVNALTKAVKEFGVKDTDIKTTNYSVYPNYDYPKISGYTVNINLMVTVRDIDRVNDILDKAASLGVNSVGNIQFTVDEQKLKELNKEARLKAIKDAKEKAEELAGLSGMTLGKIVNIQEGSNRLYPQPMYAKAEMMAGGGGAEVQPGSTDVTSSVTLFYETR